MKVHIEIDNVAAALANDCDSEQAKFLNRFSMYLKGVCKDNFQKQINFISCELNEHGENLIIELAEFIKLRSDK